MLISHKNEAQVLPSLQFTCSFNSSNPRLIVYDCQLGFTGGGLSSKLVI